jgi:flavin-dependent dehydrogenase
MPSGWWYAAAGPAGQAAVFVSDPQTVRPMLAAPALWQAALARTRHLARVAEPIATPLRLRAMAADDGALDIVGGEGWLACGDAAQTFDPLSSQGLLRALEAGRSAAQAVLDGLPAGLAAYAASLAETRRLYRLRLQTAYMRERRWPHEPFWAARGAA